MVDCCDRWARSRGVRNNGLRMLNPWRQCTGWGNCRNGVAAPRCASGLCVLHLLVGCRGMDAERLSRLATDPRVAKPYLVHRDQQLQASTALLVQTQRNGSRPKSRVGRVLLSTITHGSATVWIDQGALFHQGCLGQGESTR